MPRWAILGSVLIHVAVAATVLYVARKRPAHAETQVSIFEPAHPKPPPPRKTEEPKPPPPPKPIAHQVEIPEPVAAPPPPAPLAAQPPAAHAGGHAVALGGLQFGNGDDSGAGLEVGGGGRGPAVPESRLRSRQAKASNLAETAPCLEELSKPEPIFKPDIGYTDEARKSGIEGKLKLKFTIGADGAVAKVDVITSLDPGMDAAAVVTAMKWRFKPSARCGKAVAGGTYFWQGRFELGD